MPRPEIVTSVAKRETDLAALKSDRLLGTISDVVESQGPEASAAWLATLPYEAIDRTLADLISNPPQIDRLRPFQEA